MMPLRPEQKASVCGTPVWSVFLFLGQSAPSHSEVKRANRPSRNRSETVTSIWTGDGDMAPVHLGRLDPFKSTA